MLAAEGTARDTVSGWRYLVDADKAGTTTDLSVGLRIADTGEEFIVHLRNSVLHVSDGVDDRANAIVEPPSLLSMAPALEHIGTVQGDPAAFAVMHGFVDNEITGFCMRQR